MQYKKIISSLLTSAMLMAQTSAVFAIDVDAGHSPITQLMSVRGEAGKYNAGENVTLLLLENDANSENYTYEQVGYVEQGKVSSDGTYNFNFKFTGDVYNYKLLMNLAGQDITDTVEKATAVKDLFDVKIDINKYTTEAEAVVEIENRYGISSHGCKLIIAFYDANGVMVGVKQGDATEILQNATTTGSVKRAIPKGTETIKAMLWDSTESMIPLCLPEIRGDERIVCWGDSLTEGAGGDKALDGTVVERVTYPSVLAELTGKEVINKGIGGQSATQIAVRQGGVKLSVAEFTIPADTIPVKVDVTVSNGISIINNPDDMELSPCYIDDIEGNLTCIDDTLYFTRRKAGKAYTVPAGTQVVSGDALECTEDIAVIWIGTNGGWVRENSDWLTYKVYMEICDSMINQLENEEKEYVVVSLTHQGDAELNKMDTILTEKYSDKYIPLRQLLTDDENIYTEKGINLSDADKSLMEAGKVPSCIRIDGVHYNSVGYRIIGELVYNHMKTIGLVD